MTANNPTTDRGAQGLRYTAAYLGAMVLLFLGERLLFGTTGLRLTLAAIAVGLIGYAVVGRLRRMRRSHQLARPVETRILWTYGGGLVALLLYLAQADFVMDTLRPHFTQPHSAEHYQAALAVLWVVIWVCSVTPLLFAEVSYAPMDTSRTVDVRRIRRSLQSGLLVALTACLVIVLNYIAGDLNKKVDLSYFRTTRPSESSIKMVENLTKPLKIQLFFAKPNEVLDHVQAYFDELKGASKLLHVEVLDQALEPKLARELNVSANGTIVFTRDTQHQALVIGDKLERAKTKLKRFDGEFQRIFMKLARNAKVAYLTVGHEELNDKPRDRVQGASIHDLRLVLQRLNYQVKNLGLAQGLGTQIPTDAAMVIIVGPRKPFLPEEIQTLERYLRSGGRALLYLDPEPGPTLGNLLESFGLTFHATPLAVEMPLAHKTYTQADRHIIVSNRFGTHTSVNTLSQNSNQLAFVGAGVGYLERIPAVKGKPGPQPTIHFTVHALPNTWNDENGNFLFDSGTNEKRKAYELAAALELKSPAAAPKAGVKAKGPKGTDMRMVVIADADSASDSLLRVLGNVYLAADAIKWLGGEEKFIGETRSEEDVRIVHTRKEDVLWFYLTIFGLPAIVLGTGMAVTRRRRRRR